VAWRVAAVVCLLGLAAAVPLLTGYRPPRVVRDALAPATPHEQYLRGLQDAGLADTALATDWRNVAGTALASPAPVAVPFAEEMFLDAAAPRAAAYALIVRRGQRLEVDATLEGDENARVFLDVFDAVPAGAEPGRARASAGDNESHVAYEPDRDGRVIVRVQPELLRGGRLRVASRVAATLLFPVPAVPQTSVQSIFGDPRDAGRRTHEGVDIFAPPGTPVVAASDALVTTVGESRLGGLVVWLWDTRRAHAQYYAHLSEQLVSSGQLVRAGDVIGRVGNTGNARSTPPHLHFGIYGRTGAIDPAPFVRAAPGSAAAPEVRSIEHLGGWARVTGERAAVREGPSSNAAELAAAARNTPVRLTGALDRWVRIQLPNGAEGFMPAASLALAPAPLRRVRVTADTALRTRPDTDAPTRTLVPPATRLSVLGTFGEHVLVETESGHRGWARL
jgi:murein DD-endopeptidase MepM/ murein hydrolase activator NlpD